LAIRLEEDRTTPMPGTPSSEGGLTPPPKTDPRTPTGPTSQAREPVTKIAAITMPPGSNMDWQKPISKYLRLGAIPNDKTETWRLVRWAKGYLIHDGELYHRSTSGILQQCIPIDEGKALLLNIHEGICGHQTSSRSMLENTSFLLADGSL
jgi:hypothetical protein